MKCPVGEPLAHRLLVTRMDVASISDIGQDHQPGVANDPMGKVLRISKRRPATLDRVVAGRLERCQLHDAKGEISLAPGFSPRPDHQR